MSNDLSYFHESDLSKRDLITFFNGLPNHLQRKFKDSFGEFKFNILDLGGAKTLQGYHGPHNNGGAEDTSEYLGPSNGLQEVRYWWGASRLCDKQPYFGWGYVAADWNSLYFDSKTGECLSHYKNKAAEKLNNIGHQLFLEGKYAEAEEYHNNAYHACSSGYEYEQVFKNDRDRAKGEKDAASLNSLGESLFSEGKYSEALCKYREAYDKSIKEYNKYNANKKKAQAEIYAINLNSEGENLFSQSKYSEALSKYQEAFTKSEISKEKNKYSANKEKAQAEIDAINLNSEGDNLVSQSKYSEALNKYQKAWEKSQIKKEYNKYFSKMIEIELKEKKCCQLKPGVEAFYKY